MLKFTALLLVLLVLAQASYHYNNPQTNVKIQNIGIISCSESSKYEKSVVHKSYVDWVQSSGARAVAIPWDIEEAKLRERLESVNGILLAGCAGNLLTFDSHGGEWDFGPILNRTKLIIDIAFQMNYGGIYYPIFTIGEATVRTLVALSYDKFIIQRVSGLEGKRSHLTFTDNANKSQFYKDLPAEFMENLSENSELTNYNFKWGVPASIIPGHRALIDFVRVVATNQMPGNDEIATILEGKQRPLYMFMNNIHEDMHQYFHQKNTLDKYFNGAQLSQQYATFLGREASRNTRKFISDTYRKDVLFDNQDLTLNSKNEYVYEFEGHMGTKEVKYIKKEIMPTRTIVAIVFEIVFFLVFMGVLYRKKLKKLFKKRDDSLDEFFNDL